MDILYLKGPDMCVQKPPSQGILIANSVLFQCSQVPGGPSEGNSCFLSAPVPCLTPAAHCADTGQESGHPCLGHVISVPLCHLMKAHSVPGTDNPLIYPTIVYSWCLLCIRPRLGPGMQRTGLNPALGKSELSLATARGVREGLGKGRDQDIAP